MSPSGPSVTGLVLSGGGAYAAYEVGVLKALVAGASMATGYRPFDPGVVSGTSAGAFNAVAFVSWAEASAVTAAAVLEDIWRRRIASRRNGCGNGVYRTLLDWSGWLGPSCEPDERDGASALRSAARLSAEVLKRSASFFAATRESAARRALRVLNIADFISLDPFERLISDVIDPATVQQARRRLLVAVTNWVTGELFTFTNVDMTPSQVAPIVMGSAALPGLFPPVRLGGYMYVDGGVLMNTPLLPAILAGADSLQVIYLDPDVTTIREELDNTISILDRALMLARADIIERDIAGIARVNQSLDLADSLEGGGGRRGEPGFFATHDREGRRLRRITVHRHRPRSDLGGLAGALDMDRERIDLLIRQGEQDAINHRCDQAGCVTAMSNWGASPRPSADAPAGARVMALRRDG